MTDKILLVFFLFGFATLLFILFFYLKRRRDSALGPNVDALTAMLPNANCGACGNPGCRELAAKLLRGKAAPDACVSGGSLTAVRVARFLGQEEDIYRNQY